MCVTDLPGDPDGVLVLHDVMELVDEAYDPSERTTSAAPIVFDSDDEDLDVPPLRPRRSRSSRRPLRSGSSGGHDSDDACLGVTSLAAPPRLGSPTMLDLDRGDDTDEDNMGGIFLGSVKQRKPLEQWRLKPTITDVSVTVPVKPKPKLQPAKPKPQHRMNPKEEVKFLRERARQLEQTLETLRLQALADREKAMETAIVFNLVPQPELLAPCHNKPADWTPGSPAQTIKDRGVAAGSPAAVDAVSSNCSQQSSTDGLWERIATFQKDEYEKSMKQNKRLRAMAEQQLRALKQLQGAFRNPRAVSQQ